MCECANRARGTGVMTVRLKGTFSNHSEPLSTLLGCWEVLFANPCLTWVYRWTGPCPFVSSEAAVGHFWLEYLHITPHLPIDVKACAVKYQNIGWVCFRSAFKPNLRIVFYSLLKINLVYQEEQSLERWKWHFLCLSGKFIKSSWASVWGWIHLFLLQGYWEQ